MWCCAECVGHHLERQPRGCWSAEVSLMCSIHGTIRSPLDCRSTETWVGERQEERDRPLSLERERPIWPTNRDGSNDPGKLSSHRSNGGAEKSSVLEQHIIIPEPNFKTQSPHHISTCSSNSEFLRELVLEILWNTSWEHCESYFTQYSYRDQYLRKESITLKNLSSVGVCSVRIMNRHTSKARIGLVLFIQLIEYFANFIITTNNKTTTQWRETLAWIRIMTRTR